MSTITVDDVEVEVMENAEENQDAKKAESEPEIFSLPQEEIDRILAEDQKSRTKLPPDPCLLEDSLEEDEEPVTEYQDSMEAAGYPYW